MTFRHMTEFNDIDLDIHLFTTLAHIILPTVHTITIKHTLNYAIVKRVQTYICILCSTAAKSPQLSIMTHHENQLKTLTIFS